MAMSSKHISEAELLEKLWELLPNCQVEQDNEGQMVIYTNLIEVADGIYKDMEQGDEQ